MDLRNCRRCGVLYRFRGYNVCNSCLNKDEEDYQKVREFLEKCPKASTMELSQNTGVDVSVINRFLREGRLSAEGFTPATGAFTCEVCGVSINQGRYCESCLRKLRNEISSAINQSGSQTTNPAVENKAPRVHTIDSLKRKR